VDEETLGDLHNGRVRILLVEDDAALAASSLDGLTALGFDVEHVGTGAGALTAVVSSTPPDVVLLDLGLPDMDGQEVCRRIRAVAETPIIVVSARGDEADRVIALELGADDYLTKPFGMRELAARIRAVMRRTAPGSSARKARTSNSLAVSAISRSSTCTRWVRRSTLSRPICCVAAAAGTGAACVRRITARIRAASSRIPNGLVR
jgi:DNA-binding response OmpR family regulator